MVSKYFIKFVLILFFVFSFLVPDYKAIAAATDGTRHYSSLKPETRKIIKDITLLVSDIDFDQAFKLAKKFKDADPKGCLPNFIYQSVYYEKIKRLDSKEDIPAFYKANKAALKICEPLVSDMMGQISINENNIIEGFATGGAYGHRGLVLLAENKTLSAFPLALTARKYLEKAYSIAPDFYDVNFALGMFYANASLLVKGKDSSKMVERAVAWFIKKFLLKGEDRLNEGIRLLKIGMDPKSISSEYSKYILMSNYLLASNYDEAFKIAIKRDKVFKNDHFNSWVEARVLYDKKEYEQALRMFSETKRLVMINAKKTDNNFNDLDIALKLAESRVAEQKGDIGKSIKLNSEIKELLNNDPHFSIEIYMTGELTNYWQKELKNLEAKIKKKSNVASK